MFLHLGSGTRFFFRVEALEQAFIKGDTLQTLFERSGSWTGQNTGRFTLERWNKQNLALTYVMLYSNGMYQTKSILNLIVA